MTQTTPERWFAVFDTATSYETDEERAEARIWTLSRSHQEVGWNTDGGYDGYGLIKEDAEFLANAANEKLSRQGRLRS